MRTLAAVGGVCLVVAALVAAVFTLHGPAHSAAHTDPGALDPQRADVASPRAAGSGIDGQTDGATQPSPFRTAGTYLGGRTGTVTAAVYDLRTGQEWALGGARPQDEASVVKLDILETLLSKDAGRLPAADQPLARSMIEDSDNDAATSLWDAAGGATGIGAYDSAAGLGHTTPSACVQCAGFAWPGWGLTKTTPADQIALLRQLVDPGTLLPAAARTYALSLLENVTPDQRWGVSSGVPSDATIALKNGWLPLDSAETDWQVNSVGWISGAGRDYLIAVLTTGNPTEQYGISTIDALSARAWSALG
jgi:beta-lactamase class A